MFDCMTLFVPCSCTTGRAVPALVPSALRFSNRCECSRITTACAIWRRRSSTVNTAVRRSHGGRTCDDMNVCTPPRHTLARTATRASWMRRVCAHTSAVNTPALTRTQTNRSYVAFVASALSSTSATRPT